MFNHLNSNEQMRWPRDPSKENDDDDGSYSISPVVQIANYTNETTALLTALAMSSNIEMETNSGRHATMAALLLVLPFVNIDNVNTMQSPWNMNCNLARTMVPDSNKN